MLLRRVFNFDGEVAAVIKLNEVLESGRSRFFNIHNKCGVGVWSGASRGDSIRRESECFFPEMLVRVEFSSVVCSG